MTMTRMMVAMIDHDDAEDTHHDENNDRQKDYDNDVDDGRRWTW